MPAFEPKRFLELVEEHRATLLMMVPPALLALANADDDADLSSVQYINSGAAPLPLDVARRVNERFGCDFAVFQHDPEHEKIVFDRIEARNLQRFGVGTPEGERSLARPTAEREARKRALQTAYGAPALASLRVRAERVYRSLVPSTTDA
jgi:acyl-CoA synthetase (AMP-forming)/AMP-acid ligase II